MAILTIDAVTKSYGNVRALDGVSFCLGGGEILGLLGPNGAGKSTLMHLASGLLAPDGGRVLLAGGDSPTARAARRWVGLAPQTLALYDELTAAENLRFVGRLYGLSGGALRERVEYGLELAGLRDRRNDRVRTFSGGMKRRLNLACSLVHNPPLLLLDEPTVGVDPQTRAHLFEVIANIRDEGVSIVYATHYMEEAARLADRVAIIDHGKLLALDTVNNLISRHGGQSSVQLKVRLPIPEGVTLPAGCEGDVLRWHTAQPLEDLIMLSKQGVEWDEVAVSRPDLETVFLSLTGRSLRDDSDSTSA